MDKSLIKDKNAGLVQQMFNGIAKNYDRGNDLLTFGLHAKWKEKLVRMSGAGLGSRVLDCATGTGDVAFMFARKGAKVDAIDFSSDMLEIANSKNTAQKVNFSQQDILDLQYEDQAFDVVSISYGIRNVADVQAAINEMTRVLKKGGRLLILETGVPETAMMKLGHYVHGKMMPIISGFFNVDSDAYEYLAESSKLFPSGIVFTKSLIDSENFKAVQCIPLMGGVSYIYLCHK